MNWESVTWAHFEDTLVSYRDKFFQPGAQGEGSYLEALASLEPYALRERDAPEAIDAIVTFLNKWSCRLSRSAMEKLLREWVRQHAGSLESLADMNIVDADLTSHVMDIMQPYRALLAFKRAGPVRVHNMSDAAASKVLHLMLPSLFVMWDANIKPNFEGDYFWFMQSMQRFSRRLADIAPRAAGGEVERYLNGHLGYPVKKTLAKFIDEYNWQLAFGEQRTQLPGRRAKDAPT